LAPLNGYTPAGFEQVIIATTVRDQLTDSRIARLASKLLAHCAFATPKSVDHADFSRITACAL
jgi:hypothetical protein